VTDTIGCPGASEPPLVAAGTWTDTLNAPSLSVVSPPSGIALAPPNVRAVATLFGGNALPNRFTNLPVDDSDSSIPIAPVGTTALAVAVRLAVGDCVALEFKTPALSEAVNV
jgi:hypothetical protein